MSTSGPAIDPQVRTILDRALDDRDLTLDEAERLCATRDRELMALVSTADELRRRQVGDTATYVVNRNINFTNVCIKHCAFCAFSRDHHQEEGYLLPISRILDLAREAVRLGATEVCIQAGLPPKLPGWYYVDLVKALKREFPDLHLHAFSPEEIHYGATRARVSIRDYLTALREAGHDTIPGTSAEILDDALRAVLATGRIDTATWIDIISTAHELGFRTTATIMYGHIETYAHWVRHMARLREIQQRTGGFTEFVPLSFVHHEAPLYKSGLVQGVRAGPTGTDVVKMHAVARLMLGRSFRNIQASWAKEGPRMAQWLLTAGANDLGGTLINESISTAAGSPHGQLLGPSELRRMIREAGRVPAERSGAYRILRVFDGADDPHSALDEVVDVAAQFGSYDLLAGSSESRYRLSIARVLEP